MVCNIINNLLICERAGMGTHKIVHMTSQVILPCRHELNDLSRFGNTLSFPACRPLLMKRDPLLFVLAIKSWHGIPLKQLKRSRMRKNV